MFDKKFYSLGRLKAGEMNKTESAYSAHLETLRIAGELLWHKFEGLKLRLADNTFLTVDFFVMTSSGELQAHDVKGFLTEDANVKMKVAASMYPFEFFIIRKSESFWMKIPVSRETETKETAA